VEDCKRSRTRPRGPMGQQIACYSLSPGTNRFSTTTQIFASDGLARRFGAHLASTLGPVFAENLLRH
jgi:hypothetical protein